MLADNHTLVFLGTWLYKLKLTNQRPSCLAVDLLYDMSQALIPKASPEDIYPRDLLIVGGILETLRINYNKIISGIPNGIPSPYSLQYVVN